MLGSSSGTTRRTIALKGTTMTSPDTTAEPVLYELAERIATITINRPDQMNSIDGAATRSLRDAIHRFESDSDAWVAIITGAGDRAFCAGMDLKAFAAGEESEIVGGPGHFGGFVRAETSKPIIAAVNGFALAGGCEIVLACDLVVASDTARFGTPEVGVGIFAAAGAAFRLPRRLPRAVAMEMLLTGDPIDAQTARDHGLVNRVVPAAEVMVRARELAARITANAPLPVRASLQLARSTNDHAESDLWDLNEHAWNRIRSTADASEGPRAFAEKRPPVWTGS